MKSIKRVTVFCGSSSGYDDIFEHQAYLLGAALADKGIEIVYGGAKVGLMGSLANGALNHGGKVIGVIPSFLQHKEIAHSMLTELIVVQTMHERKMRMHELSDGVIALPGGFGTLEEFFEMLTWAQLGLHQKPIAIFNIDGFYDHLIAMLDTMVSKGLLKEQNRKMLLIGTNAGEILNVMQRYKAPVVEKWITKKTV